MLWCNCRKESDASWCDVTGLTAGRGATLRELAEELALSRERIRQLHGGRSGSGRNSPWRRTGGRNEGLSTEIPRQKWILRDRHEAGSLLAERLSGYRDQKPIVLALTRRGVVVGYEVARALGAPLDVVVARKLGAPGHPELAVGAIAPRGVRVLNEDASRGSTSLRMKSSR